MLGNVVELVCGLEMTFIWVQQLMMKIWAEGRGRVLCQEKAEWLTSK